MSTVASVIDRLTVNGEIVQKLPDGSVRCFACGHRCLIHPGKRGICQVRFNEGGELKVPCGYVAALQSDPIEKKPFFHVFPGENALTFGMLGCDFHCGYCQNWLTSQAMRDPASDESVHYIHKITPKEWSRQPGGRVLPWSSPPTTSRSSPASGPPPSSSEAKAAGLKCAYVSNGNNTPEVMDYLRPYLDAYKVDLKCMQDKNYRKLGGVLQNTLDGIQRAQDMGLWVEVVTLTIPDFNDSNEELWDAARFIAGVSQDIPWHVTAFHKDYKMTDHDQTSVDTLVRAAEIGREAGLRYVYAGNLPGRVGEYEDTSCPQCNERLIQRQGYVITAYRITGQGTCPRCGTHIPGLWPQDPSSVQLNGFGFPLPVY